jgi:amicoumacin kinase
LEKEIRDRYNDAILQEAMARYGIAGGGIKLLGTVESFVYAYTRGGGRYILRLGHSRRRTPDLIRGEVDWINYLAAGGAGVARAVRSQTGLLVEEIPDEKDGRFLATAFEHAQGVSPWDMDSWNGDFMVNYGRLLGRIHALSKDYKVADAAWRRPEWDDPRNVSVPALEADIDEKYQAVLAHLRALPQDRDSYGMIHQDAHAGNFFVDADGRLTLFDFDDCVYGHFVYDLAMVLFYTLTGWEDAAESAPGFWRRFMQGYEMENDLDPAWLREIPAFLKLREIDLYGYITRDYDSLQDDTWAMEFLNGRRQKILDETPYLGAELF